MKADAYCLPPGPQHLERKIRELENPEGDFEQVDLGMDEAHARASASRCLSTLVCTYCDVCQWVCPDMCITRNPDTDHINIDLDYCKGCGLCAHFCPKGAIKMEVEPRD